MKRFNKEKRRGEEVAEFVDFLRLGRKKRRGVIETANFIRKNDQFLQITELPLKSAVLGKLSIYVIFLKLIIEILSILGIYRDIFSKALRHFFVIK